MKLPPLPPIPDDYLAWDAEIRDRITQPKTYSAQDALPPNSLVLDLSPASRVADAYLYLEALGDLVTLHYTRYLKRDPHDATVAVADYLRHLGRGFKLAAYKANPGMMPQVLVTFDRADDYQQFAERFAVLIDKRQMQLAQLH